ncbi:hypothetical protein H6F77_26165 [Microcoleus sp. FACHB-831]|uniref:hypothetical protein n=1 Tax=Microcoleus sp. FACHB-831 TaxID=2692827 RepID=UPI0016878AFD|nr:hypothetical protein [Microcoleus sp. FACHB-831]MBD1924525.1 hypothetical protein [Microcoleus sp. FACHB-831]
MSKFQSPATDRNVLAEFHTNKYYGSLSGEACPHPNLSHRRGNRSGSPSPAGEGLRHEGVSAYRKLGYFLNKSY